ncbi:MAG: cyclic nucleotide-binding domain-containing protein [Deltaproteobacteria bacterium]|nr:cyclic nucleotide-binding domain-containing protein [Deltaproteobacteria bacterium]
MEKVFFLKEIEMFKNVKISELTHIAEIMQEVHFNKNETIFKEEEVGDAMYFVVQGKVQILKEEKPVASIMNNGTFGDFAILDNAPRYFTATAFTETDALKIDASDFFYLVEDHIEIAFGIFKVLTRRIMTKNIYEK